MATYTYTTTLTKVDDSTINLATTSVTPSIGSISASLSSLTNQRTVVSKITTAFLPTYPFPNSYDLNSVVATMGSIYGDSVYEYGAVFTAGADTYTSSSFLLITTTIDAGIAALPSTTPAEIARKAYLVGLGQTIQAAPLTTNLERAAVNALIGVVESYLFHLTNAAAAVTATLSAPTDMDVEISPLAFTYLPWGGWYNALTNTLTNVVYPYTFNFDPNAGGTYTVVNPTDYPDGVYENYMSVLGSISATDANLFYGTAYELVTTTIDNQITLYGENYDPNNVAEATAYAQMIANQTAWIAAFADNDYTLTNTLIEATQGILANGVSIDLFAALTNSANMQVYFEDLPTGTYTNATATIQNTLIGSTPTSFDGFPANEDDLSTTLNSVSLDFGTDFPDGVYQLIVNFYVDGLLFTSMCYLPVTTDWQCCISRAAGKKCGKLDVALQQANLEEAVELVTEFADIDTANGLIKEGNRVCSGCGCGCK